MLLGFTQFSHEAPCIMCCRRGFKPRLRAVCVSPGYDIYPLQRAIEFGMALQHCVGILWIDNLYRDKPVISVFREECE